MSHPVYPRRFATTIKNLSLGGCLTLLLLLAMVPAVAQDARGGVTAPKVLSSVQPQYTERARKARLSGDVIITVVVDKDGNPTNVRVIRSLGMGLDENAVRAVQQYKFAPAMKDGAPTPVQLSIEVHFQISKS